VEDLEILLENGRMSGTSSLDLLHEAMNDLVPPELYPWGVIPIPKPKIAGTAFFPGGSGLYLEGHSRGEVELPVGGVMVLGHNFDSEAGFSASVTRGKEKLTTGTWGRLLKLLGGAEVPVAQCFFTNAFMGLCEGDDSFDYRGRAHGAFRMACSAFLRAQIEFQRPRLILTLGRHVPPILAELSPELSVWLRPDLRLDDFDATPLIPNAGFHLSTGWTHRAVVVPLAHPSMPNGSRRKPKGYSPGWKGELEVIRAGWGNRF
jgi:hypothetical protein